MFSFLPAVKPGRSLLDDEGRNAVMSGRLVGHGHRDADVPVSSVRGESLLAIENPVGAVEPGRCLCAAGVASGFGFSQAPGAKLLALCKRNDETLRRCSSVPKVKMWPVQSEL